MLNEKDIVGRISPSELKFLVAVEMGFRPQDVEVVFDIQDTSGGYQGQDKRYEIVSTNVYLKKD